MSQRTPNWSNTLNQANLPKLGWNLYSFAEHAKELGYKYITWSGWVYDVNTTERLDILAEHLANPAPEVKPVEYHDVGIVYCRSVAVVIKVPAYQTALNLLYDSESTGKAVLLADYIVNLTTNTVIKNRFHAGGVDTKYMHSLLEYAPYVDAKQLSSTNTIDKIIQKNMELHDIVHAIADPNLKLVKVV